MKPECTLQLFSDGAWHDVGAMTLFGPENEGWKASTYTGYHAEWAVAHHGARDAHAFSCQYPVGLAAYELPHWPVFLIDLLPQGHGREELLRRLQRSPGAGIEADWQLLMTGAGNPIGNLRIKEAAQWQAEHDGPLRGFTDAEVAARAEDFTEFLARHGLFVAGSSGVQGEWPKILLTRADDGLLYLDHTLPDERARTHYIVKFGRGKDERLAAILRHEVPYMELARLLGLRVHGALWLEDRALFIPRFDRRVTAPGPVIRLAQESIATLTGLPGFGVVPTHDEVCRALLARCTHPQDEVLEYIKRDVANLALGNKDNHARNTAVQRDFTGNVALTPLFDFVPMYLHPDGIARRIRWEGNDDGQPDWSRVIDRVCALAAEAAQPVTRKRRKTAQPAALQREALVQGLKAMAPALRHIAANGTALGLDREVHAHLVPAIENQARQLEALS